VRFCTPSLPKIASTAAGSQRRGLLRGGDTLVNGGVVVTRLVGMKSYCRQCVRIGGRRGQCGQRATVQFDPIEVGDLRLGGPAGKLMTKPD
jgi:hypothetical protein